MMDKDEAVHNLETVGHISTAHAEDLYDSFFARPAIPYYIADYIEKVKSEGDLTVVGAVNEAPDGPIRDWLFLERVNTFAKAWINGYEVEKEPRYTVKYVGLSSSHRSYLNCNDSHNKWFMSDDKETEIIHTKHTRKELEDANFGWVFDCEGVEVKEVDDGKVY